MSGPAPIPASQLQNCDVLLYRGIGTNARLIRLFDGSEVSHAGLRLDGQVAEVLNDAAGLQIRPLATGFEQAEWAVARRHGGAGDASAIAERAAAYLGSGARYAYEQIVMLGFLIATRRLPFAPSLGALVRGMLDGAAERLVRLLDRGRQPMICSEFVFRCYAEARQGGNAPFAIELPARGEGGDGLESTFADSAPEFGRVHRASLLANARERGVRDGNEGLESLPAPPRSDAELERLGAAYLAEADGFFESLPKAVPPPPADDALLRFAAAYRDASGGPAGGLERVVPPLEFLGSAAADFVTPGDLYRTRSLRTLGRIEIPPA